ncbi:MAG: hypothetical protein U9N47_02440 [Thermodesulfobacteriota bacterium]|nr:hypothetical protein [Thermodesulfobacteriota bacterium]
MRKITTERSGDLDFHVPGWLAWTAELYEDVALGRALAIVEAAAKAEAYFLYRGKERLMIKDIHCIPCEQFLLQLKPERSMSQGLAGRAGQKDITIER